MDNAYSPTAVGVEHRSTEATVKEEPSIPTRHQDDQGDTKPLFRARFDRFLGILGALAWLNDTVCAVK